MLISFEVNPYLGQMLIFTYKLVECHLQGKLRKSIPDSHSGSQVKFHHGVITHLLVHLNISRPFHIYTWTYLYMFVGSLKSREHSTSVLGYIHVICNSTNIYCICNVLLTFSLIMNLWVMTEFSRSMCMYKGHTELIKPWMSICTCTLYLLLMWCQTFSVQTWLKNASKNALICILLC